MSSSIKWPTWKLSTQAINESLAVFGSRVLLENLDTRQDVEYQLVGPDESDIENGRISVVSPLGKAIIGRKPGDELVIEVPGGKRIYELIEIR